MSAMQRRCLFLVALALSMCLLEACVPSSGCVARNGDHQLVGNNSQCCCCVQVSVPHTERIVAYVSAAMKERDARVRSVHGGLVAIEGDPADVLLAVELVIRVRGGF